MLTFFGHSRPIWTVLTTNGSPKGRFRALGRPGRTDLSHVSHRPSQQASQLLASPVEIGQREERIDLGRVPG